MKANANIIMLACNDWELFNSCLQSRGLIIPLYLDARKLKGTEISEEPKNKLNIPQ